MSETLTTAQQRREARRAEGERRIEQLRSEMKNPKNRVALNPRFQRSANEPISRDNNPENDDPALRALAREMTKDLYEKAIACSIRGRGNCRRCEREGSES